MPSRGTEAFLQMLADAGVTHVFGNPGTTELPLIDALATDQRFKFVLGLHEVAVTSMADGYAQASRGLGFVNLHISCGLGNAMGMLYNAHRAGTPLLVTAGQQDRRLMFEEPILWSDMVSVARPYTKWSVEVNHLRDLPSAFRRAVQTALTPPTGPVFMSIPVDLWWESAELDLTPARLPNPQVCPPAESLRQALSLLRSAKNPAILAGSRVQELNAVAELQKLAELFGVPVLIEAGTAHGRLGFPCDHPLAGQGLPLWSPDVHKRLEEFDLLFAVGLDLLRQYVYYPPDRPIPAATKLIHLDEDAWQLGKNYPLDVPLLGHAKPALGALWEIANRELNPVERAAMQVRGELWTKEHAARRQKLLDQAEQERGTRPMTSLTVMHQVAKVLPANAAVVEEAVTTTNTSLERLGALKDPSGYFGHRGWALGWGLGASLGVKLAWPDRPVLAILGEGGAMFGIQGLWTAAKEKLPVTFLLCNNAQYRILKVGARQMELPNAMSGNFLGMDLSQPEIDFVQLSQALGVPAVRASEPEQLAELLTESFRGDGPRLIDLAVERALPSKLNYG